MLGIFGIGPTELLIILIVLGGFVLTPLIVLWFAFRAARGARMLPCSNCGGAVVPGSNYCPHCGSRMRP